MSFPGRTLFCTYSCGPLVIVLTGSMLVACARGDVDDDDPFAGFTLSGDGDGDPSGDGDGDPSQDGDGDGDPSGDGDGDPSGDGDGDPSSCGDGILDVDEECDGGQLGGESCESLGFDSGTLACASCSFDTSACANALCGNGVVEQTEVCDGAELAGQDCSSQGFVFGSLACAGDCASLDTSGCANQTIFDFETGQVPAGFLGGGNAQWSVGTGGAYEGSFRARAGLISHSQSSYVEVAVSYPIAGTVSFHQRISSESGYDYGRFSIDGAQQGQWSGSGSWALQSYPVSAGQHTLRWTYVKDGSVSSFDDTWYVDYVVLANGMVP